MYGFCVHGPFATAPNKKIFICLSQLCFLTNLLHSLHEASLTLQKQYQWSSRPGVVSFWLWEFPKYWSSDGYTNPQFCLDRHQSWCPPSLSDLETYCVFACIWPHSWNLKTSISSNSFRITSIFNLMKILWDGHQSYHMYGFCVHGPFGTAPDKKTFYLPISITAMYFSSFCSTVCMKNPWPLKKPQYH